VTTLSDSLRAIADRVAELEASVIDFGDEMLIQTVADEVKMALEQRTPAPVESDVARAIAVAVCVLLNDIAEDGQPATKPDWNDPRITSGRGDGKP
jgi:hypothetical protein